MDGKDTFTYTYTVAEDQDSFDEGVTAIAGSFQIKVTVTDNNDGTLSTSVVYPDGGNGLEFRNAYGESETGQATLHVNGTKTLEVESGDNAPDIAGKYTFTLSGSDGTPMPDKTTANNDAAGNVDFGDITYTMENVFGDTGSQDATTEGGASTLSAERTKAFEYMVTESGSVDGVTNDPQATKTFTVTVTDNGDGTISVATDQATDFEFGFTNTYSVTPADSSLTGEGGIAITKQLTGRNLNEGEFAFQMSGLASPDEVDPGANVLTGTNDANGNVSFDAITFTEPGTYSYGVAEVDNGLGGVTYDGATYLATATVTDKGDGTLDVKWTVTDANGNPVDGITFDNAYAIDQPGSIIFGATKVLDGKELADGQFTFELKDDQGNVLQSTTNKADGSVVFSDPVTYGQPGTYSYTVSEVNDGQDNVTYDDTVYTATVTVTDNGDGSTTATIDYGTGSQLPEFDNVYTEPAGGADGEGPEEGPLEHLAKTSDTWLPYTLGVLAAVAAAAMGLAIYMMRRTGGNHRG